MARGANGGSFVVGGTVRATLWLLRGKGGGEEECTCPEPRNLELRISFFEKLSESSRSGSFRLWFLLCRREQELSEVAAGRPCPFHTVSLTRKPWDERQCPSCLCCHGGRAAEAPAWLWGWDGQVGAGPHRKESGDDCPSAAVWGGPGPPADGRAGADRQGLLWDRSADLGQSQASVHGCRVYPSKETASTVLASGCR